MLCSLKVKGFRNFGEEFEVNLLTDKSYEFNSHAVENGVVSSAVIYGGNGVGKSNLGLVILDLTCHLLDSPNIIPSLYLNYLNANMDEGSLATFKYTFEFDGVKVVYHYGKENCSETVFEELYIEETKVVSIDRRKSAFASYNLVGAEHLKNDFTGRKISPIKFLESNALLEETIESKAFFQFIEFVEGMVFFRTLTKTTEFHGRPLETKRISQRIIEQDKLKDFEAFLNESGVECKLIQTGDAGKEQIEFDFGNKSIEFSQIASTGTVSLGNFYYWYLKMLSEEITFAYIDEFDAYYHFALSKRIVKLVSKASCQSIITTHNSTLLSNHVLRPDCYYILDQNALKPLHELTDRELRKAHNLEKMYRAGAFNE
ncbi:AAA family ATPase [Vibrio neptunius]|uniref:ATP-binding protein n=1 Tax=Vibrio neptunius TaxID=170651 RepID=A0ABS3A8Z7_9VIBR|nr:AAA family ATPase [Vibrio neptunius]MBN3495751.1 ATP-binding protein [Vibrio neptunius]MBN3514510.1 ATP-binding protein [Vibrio neptunius]MBN3548375.1 ATP-binding protein [Vibrio neptunius]MBN3580565.1 ATP-binding protein [Vibrio neptunius]MCH9874232.1 ATP-binding protein [Vibrio neptunius]